MNEHRELPRYMQTVTNNQEQTVNAARDIMDNYIESQRDITNSFQSAWSSFFDNYFWISPKRITETYTRTAVFQIGQQQPSGYGMRYIQYPAK